MRKEEYEIGINANFLGRGVCGLKLSHHFKASIVELCGLEEGKKGGAL